MLTKEEAHWNSFRIAVGSLQQTLLESNPPQLSDYVRNGSRDSRCSNHTDGRGIIGIHEQSRDKRHNTKTSISNSQSSIIDDTSCQEKNSSSMPKHQNVISKSSNKTWDDRHDETSQRHENKDLEINSLEVNTDVILTGLEEVSKNVLHSNNNMIVGGGTTNNLISPTNATSHASHTTMNALSVAEQSLVETRLKLAMTESERDELEFQLIQNS